MFPLKFAGRLFTAKMRISINIIFSVVLLGQLILSQLATAQVDSFKEIRVLSQNFIRVHMYFFRLEKEDLHPVL